jgi:signal peptidase I
MSQGKSPLTGRFDKRDQETMARSSTVAHTKPQQRAAKTTEAPREGHRETVEAIVVAFILALVVRGFEAQAFVIPTGSMAPTLMGRHKEIACPQCGFVYAVNASQEVEAIERPQPVRGGICVNCRYLAHLEDKPSYKGDRILVSMFPYDLPNLPGSHEPERWDVVVFRYPEDPEVSYIKRLVGLPGDTIRIFHGDIYVKRAGDDRFQLARKPYRHQAAMQITAYDDRYQPKALVGRAEWQRWQPGNGFKAVDAGVSRYQADGASGGEWAVLRYKHLVPDPEQWDAVLNDRPLPRAPRSSLITDFYSYNTSMAGADSSDDPMSYSVWMAWKQPHWVGDLTLESTIDVASVAEGGSVRFELIKAGLPCRATVDLATGVATFARGTVELGHCDTSIKGPGRYKVTLANVDDGLVLAVNGTPVRPDAFLYESSPDAPSVPTEADLSPAAIAVRNASVTTSDLVVKRDIYYTEDPSQSDYGPVWENHYPQNPVELLDFLSDPTRFERIKKVTWSREYPIGQDRFFMMGDNSPCSSDSRRWGARDRAWTRRPKPTSDSPGDGATPGEDDAEWGPPDRQNWEVPRRLLTGRAFYVYWPHGVPFWPDFKVYGDLRFPFRPYFERMKWIR